ncbi:hypothetical protein TrVE_jg11226 [Triparma verrucosa]|uniref:RRM domain-containing protein n=1 Tax=Triparma verrucosa TaxID=1606542 RepID=A0A9W7F7G3_9STRA|nr:hypothetical protein TrVE_jg11226 [Triparma verrucosa]
MDSDSGGDYTKNATNNDDDNDDTFYLDRTPTFSGALNLPKNLFTNSNSIEKGSMPYNSDDPSFPRPPPLVTQSQNIIQGSVAASNSFVVVPALSTDIPSVKVVKQRTLSSQPLATTGTSTTSTSNSNIKVITKPPIATFLKKNTVFVGGSEAARKRARLQLNRPPPSNSHSHFNHTKNHKHKRDRTTRGSNFPPPPNLSLTPIPSRLSSFERFYAIMFYGLTVSDYVKDDYYYELARSHSSRSLRLEDVDINGLCRHSRLMERLCAKASIVNHHKPSPTCEKVPKTFKGIREYWDTQAYGVLDEARGAIVQSLQKHCEIIPQSPTSPSTNVKVTMKYARNSSLPPSTPILRLLSSTDSTRHLSPSPQTWEMSLPALTFSTLPPPILDNFKVGSYMLLVPYSDWGSSSSLRPPIFASVHPNCQRNFNSPDPSSNVKVTLIAYTESEFDRGENFYYLELGNGVKEVRSLDSLSRGGEVGFWESLVGGKRATHIKFGEEEVPSSEPSSEPLSEPLSELSSEPSSDLSSEALSDDSSVDSSSSESFSDSSNSIDAIFKIKPKPKSTPKATETPKQLTTRVIPETSALTFSAASLLNPSQLSASNLYISKCTSSVSLYNPSTQLGEASVKRSSRDVTLVQGPPGTGKTSFLVNTLLRIVEMRREKVKRDYGRQEQKAYEERRFLEDDINHVDTKLWEGRVLYVNNLDFGINDDRLREEFSRETKGKILNCLVMKWNTQGELNGQSRGKGFVEYETKEEAEKARNVMHGRVVEGKSLFVVLRAPLDKPPKRKNKNRAENRRLKKEKLKRVKAAKRKSEGKVVTSSDDEADPNPPPATDEYDSIHEQRTLICAPSNRAVIVVARRFLAAINKHRLSSYVRCSLVGVESKLEISDGDSGSDSAAVDDDGINSGRRQTLQSIFVWSTYNDLLDIIYSAETAFNPYIGSASESLNIMEKLRTIIYNELPRTWLKVKSLFISFFEDLSNNKFEDAKSRILMLKEVIISTDPAKIVNEKLNNSDIIFCTLASAGCSAMKSTSLIDNLIIDEAGACSEAECIIPFILKPKRLMLIGDPKQLPPTVMSKRGVRMGFDISMLERMMGLGYEYALLDTQYRMRPQISRWPSKEFYEGRVKDGVEELTGEEERKKRFRVQSEVEEGELVFIDTKGRCRERMDGRKSYSNDGEAKLIVSILKDLRSFNGGEGRWDCNSKIRVITFYQGQVHAIKRHLRSSNMHNVTVATVDSSQGSEAEVVIVSFVRSREGGGVGFLNDGRRINVGLTRAKEKLICVGDVATIRRGKILKRFIEDIEQRENIIL